ncbi:MAG TPA: lysophospholipid acyltransferase family protein [Jatrophihabitantaceae bacterium]
MSRVHKPKAGAWIRFAVIIVYPIVGLVYRARWRGLDRIPATGGLIIAINHVSHMDTLVMARMTWQAGRIPRFLVKNTIVDKPVLGAIMRGCKQIPVYRGTTDAAKSLNEAVKALDNGEAIVIYPEGTTTKDPAQWPMQAKTGVARLALLAPHIRVVPVGQWGAQKVRKRRFRPRVEASVGPAVDLSRYHDAEPTGEALREITDVIMAAIRDEVAKLRDEAPPADFYENRA